MFSPQPDSLDPKVSSLMFLARSHVVHYSSFPSSDFRRTICDCFRIQYILASGHSPTQRRPQSYYYPPLETTTPTPTISITIRIRKRPRHTHHIPPPPLQQPQQHHQTHNLHLPTPLQPLQKPHTSPHGPFAHMLLNINAYNPLIILINKFTIPRPEP